MAPRKRTPEDVKRAKARARQAKYVQRLRGTVDKTASLTSVTHLNPTVPLGSLPIQAVNDDASLTRLERMADRVRKSFALRFERSGLGLFMQANHPAVQDVARWILSLPEDKRDQTAGRALDAFFADAFARKAGYPIKLFAANPAKYLLQEDAAPAKPELSDELKELVRMRESRERRPWN